MPSPFTIVYFSCVIVEIVLGQRCYTSNAEFAEDCSTIYNGVVDGGRCFFIPAGVTASWGDAASKCPPDTEFAQIHTASELDKIGKIYNGFTWTAMANPSASPKSVCPGTNDLSFLSLSGSYWYDSGTQNLNLPASKTWIRHRMLDDSCGDDAFYRAGDCVSLWKKGPVLRFGDNECTAAKNILCVFSSLVQNYTLVPGVFITEASIEKIDVIDKQECVNACSQRMWCRSFNACYNVDMQLYVCQLYTWAHADGPETDLPDDGCEYYSYDA